MKGIIIMIATGLSLTINVFAETSNLEFLAGVEAGIDTATAMSDTDLEHTQHGRWIFGIGGNPNAARAVGINVDNMLILVYTICGGLAGFAALILAGRTNSGYPNAGLQSELDAIAAVIIGGASFFGGRGTVIGVFSGVFLMGLLRNGLNLMDVSVFWQQITIGVIIIIAVYLDVLRREIGTRK